MKNFIKMYTRYFDFKGRTSRKTYWMSMLLFVVVSFIIAALSTLVGVPMISNIWGILNIIPMLSIMVRRLHDSNHRGWWSLFMLIPLVGWILVLIYMCYKSEDSENRFGDFEE